MKLSIETQGDIQAIREALEKMLDLMQAQEDRRIQEIELKNRIDEAQEYVNRMQDARRLIKSARQKEQ